MVKKKKNDALQNIQNEDNKVASLNSLPDELKDVIGSKLGYPSKLRQTAHNFKKVKGNDQHTTLEETGNLRTSCLFRKHKTPAEVKVQLLNAIKNGYIELRLKTYQGEKCLETFSIKIKNALKMVCTSIRRLDLSTLGPEPMFSDNELSSLFSELLPSNNTINMLRIISANVDDISRIITNYPTDGKIQAIMIILPAVFVAFEPDQNEASEDWLPNIVKQTLFNIITNLEKEKNRPCFENLKMIKIMSLGHGSIEPLRLHNGNEYEFEFSFDRSDAKIFDFA